MRASTKDRIRLTCTIHLEVCDVALTHVSLYESTPALLKGQRRACAAIISMEYQGLA